MRGKLMETRILSYAFSALMMFGAVAFISFASTPVSAAGVGGTWVSSSYGEGYVLNNVPTGPYTWHYDVTMELSQSGTVVSGSATFELVTVDLNNPTYDPWTEGIGVPFTYTVTGYTEGSTFIMQLYTSGAIATFHLTFSSGSMYGSATYSDVGNLWHGEFDLEKSGGALDLGLGLEFLVDYNDAITIVVIVVAITAMAVATIPVVPKGLKIPPPGPSPSTVGETAWQMPGTPGAGRPVGGVGVHTPAPPVKEMPLPPSEYFTKVSQTPPACPHHPNVFLVPQFSSGMPGDAGAWYCPMCGGYPWGQPPKGRG